MRNRSVAVLEGHPDGAGVVALGREQIGEVVERLANIPVVLAIDPLTDSEAALQEGPCTRQIPSCLEQEGDVIEACRDIFVIRTERGLAYGQRSSDLGH